jgi:hypothetical protein
MIGYEGLGDMGAGPTIATGSGVFTSTIRDTVKELFGNPTYEQSYGEVEPEKFYVIIESIQEGGHSLSTRTRVEYITGTKKLNDYLLNASGRLKSIKVFEAQELEVKFDLQLKKK